MSAAFADDDTSLSGPNTTTVRANGRTPPAAVDIGSLHLLIYSYLLHNNCGRTAKAFARTCGLATSGSLTSGGVPSFLASLPAPADADTSDDEEEDGEDEYEDAASQCAASTAASLKHKQRQQQQQRNEVGAVSAVVLGKRPVSSGRMAIDGDDDDDDDILPSAPADAAAAAAGIREESFLDDASDASQECMENDDDGIGTNASTAAAGIGSRSGGGLDYMHGALSSGGAAIAPGNVAAGAAGAAASESEVERANKLIDHHIECLRIRQSICSSIEAGEPKVALDLLATYFRDVLIPPPAESLAVSPLPLRSEFDATLLRFRLDTQHY
ncbi:hypothetical protein GGI11_008358, partial [Coemansia sp. RSA 2049]